MDLRIEDYTRYALSTQSVNSFNQQHHIDQSGSISAPYDHATVLDFVPKPNAFSDLFQLDQRKRWAYFPVPDGFDHQRGYFFGSYRPAEEDELHLDTVGGVNCQTPNLKETKAREREKMALQDVCLLKKQLREDHSYIIGRMQQFVQG